MELRDAVPARFTRARYLMTCSSGQLRTGAPFCTPACDSPQGILTRWAQVVSHALQRIPTRCPGKAISTAVTDHVGTACFDRTQHLGAGHLVSATTVTSGTTFNVRTPTLNKFVLQDGNPPPSFVKIDIEGQKVPRCAVALRSQRNIDPSL